MEDKTWVIPVCLFGAVEEIILVLSDELLKYYMEARNCGSERNPMLHNVSVMLDLLI